MDQETRRFVRERAGNRCEYCRISQETTPLASHHIEHIRARQHGGDDSLDNLALACDRCNAFKGPNLTSISRESGQVVGLFNPREHRWDDHFRQENGLILGLTETGNATVLLLNMNAHRRVMLRRLTS